MIDSYAKRSLRKFSRALGVVLLFMLAVHLLPAQAAEQTASQTHAAASKKHHAKKTHGSKTRHAKTRHARAHRTSLHYGGTPAETFDGRSLLLKSNAALVVDQETGETLVTKNADAIMPIASLTKLMTGLVVVDAKLPMDEVLEITSEDVDSERNTHSRLSVGTRLTRGEMLLLALMSSENRAALALSRNYPGGRSAFIAQMNAKAQALGMTSTHFADPAGLSNGSVSTARDLHRLLGAAYAQPLIRHDSTQDEATVRVKGRELTFISSNRLVRYSDSWDIELQKTGFTNEAGRCLVMRVSLEGRKFAMIFLDSVGKLTRYADAARVRDLLERESKSLPRQMASGARAVSSP